MAKKIRVGYGKHLAKRMAALVPGAKTKKPKPLKPPAHGGSTNWREDRAR